jgi:hypothetical protein
MGCIPSKKSIESEPQMRSLKISPPVVTHKSRYSSTEHLTAEPLTLGLTTSSTPDFPSDTKDHCHTPRPQKSDSSLRRRQVDHTPDHAYGQVATVGLAGAAGYGVAAFGYDADMEGGDTGGGDAGCGDTGCGDAGGDAGGGDGGGGE